MSKEIKKEVKPVSGGIVDKAAAEKNAQIITINVLKAYAKGIVGKQRKYLDAVPKFDVDEVAEAMRFAAKHLAYRIVPAHFIQIVSAAEATEKRIKRYLKDGDKALRKVQNKDLIPQMKEELEKVRLELPALCEAVKEAKKIVRMISKAADAKKGGAVK